jgi:hypothetical protein
LGAFAKAVIMEEQDPDSCSGKIDYPRRSRGRGTCGI